jgi:hypothetical protein
MTTLHPVRNRSAITGRFLPGILLRTEDGEWVGPYLGDFRSIRDARDWVESLPAWRGYRLSQTYGDEMANWDGEGCCPKCQGDDCLPETGCIHDK